MATSAYVNQSFDVNVVMAEALVANAPHAVAFSGPLAGPSELQINSGGGMTFTSANWSVPQIINVTGKRPGTVNLNYVITSTYTKRTKTGTIPLTIDPIPLDTFIPTGSYLAPSGLGSSTVYPLLGYIIKSSASALPMTVSASPSLDIVARSASGSAGSFAGTSGTLTVTGAAGATIQVFGGFTASGTTYHLNGSPTSGSLTLNGAGSTFQKVTLVGVNLNISQAVADTFGTAGVTYNAFSGSGSLFTTRIGCSITPVPDNTAFITADVGNFRIRCSVASKDSSGNITVSGTYSSTSPGNTGTATGTLVSTAFTVDGTVYSVSNNTVGASPGISANAFATPLSFTNTLTAV